MFLPKSVVITSFARTPITSFQGSLSQFTAPHLASFAISSALDRSHIEGSDVQLVVLGHGLPAGVGQSPARQASLKAGIPASVDVFGVNKVCASGMKSIVLAAQSIALGQADIVVAGGMESMSRAPYYLDKARQGGYKYGHGKILDGLLHDGLWDPYNNLHMGQCAEKTATELNITRKDQDNFARLSYQRAADAWKSGTMPKEIVPVRVLLNPKKASDPSHLMVAEDEEYSKLNVDKLSALKPSFDPSGTITAANSSSLNDGAAAVVLMAEEKAKSLGVTPLARVLSFADAAIEPVDFPQAPAQAVRRALKLAGLARVDVHEINEAFAAVTLANMQLLGLDESTVNLRGGAVSLGHPIGMSGCRIVGSLIHSLRMVGGNVGCASICNGGGGSTAMVLESV